MFVTVFLGMMNVATGELRYCNAGHLPPLVARSGQTQPERLLEGACRVLGADEGSLYESGQTRLAPGDSLLIYTDGISDALDRTGVAFGEDRLFEALCFEGERSAAELAESILAEVRAHAEGCAQFDDTTVMALRMIPPELLGADVA